MKEILFNDDEAEQSHSTKVVSTKNNNSSIEASSPDEHTITDPFDQKLIAAYITKYRRLCTQVTTFDPILLKKKIKETKIALSLLRKNGPYKKEIPEFSSGLFGL
jgi:hypothetical protein